MLSCTPGITIRYCMSDTLLHIYLPTTRLMCKNIDVFMNVFLEHLQRRSAFMACSRDFCKRISRITCKNACSYETLKVSHEVQKCYPELYMQRCVPTELHGSCETHIQHVLFVPPPPAEDLAKDSDHLPAAFPVASAEFIYSEIKQTEYESSRMSSTLPR